MSPPKHKVKQQALSDFSATITAKPDLTKEEIFSKFPEFNNDESFLQSVMDYHATASSGKYKDVAELNSKFPEFEFEANDDSKKKEPGGISSPTIQSPLMDNGLTEEQDKQKALQELSGDNGIGALGTAAGNFNKGVLGVISGGLKGMAEMALPIDQFINPDRKIEDQSLYQLGQGLDELADKTGVVATNQAKENFLTRDVAQGLGSAAGFAMTLGRGGAGAAAPALEGQVMSGGKMAANALAEGAKAIASPTGLLGGAVSVDATFQEAKAAGKDDSEAWAAGMQNFLGGTTEALPLQNIFNRLNQATGGTLGKKLVNYATQSVTGGIEEGLQEAVQTYFSNQVAKGNYDPERDPMVDVLKSGGTAFTVGLILPFAANIPNISKDVSQKIVESLTKPVDEKSQEQPAAVDEGTIVPETTKEEPLPVQTNEEKPTVPEEIIQSNESNRIPESGTSDVSGQQPSTESATSATDLSPTEQGNASPTETADINSEEGGVRKKALLNRAIDGDANADVKAAVEKHGLTYEPETWLHAKERAKSFVAEVGYDKALDAVRRNEIEDGAAAFVWSEIIDDVGDQLANTDNEEDRARLVKLEADLISEFDRKARSGGRFISALQDVYENSDFGFKYDVQVDQYKARNNGVIEPEVEAKFKELDKQLSEAKSKRVEAEDRAKKAEDELALKNIKDSIERTRKQNTRSAQKIREARSERSKLKSEFLSKFNPAKSGGQLNATIPGAVFIEYGIKVANTYIKEGVARIEDIITRTKEFFDSELKYKISDKEVSDLKDRITTRLKEIDEKAGKISIPHSLVRDYVEAGVKDIDELVSKIKEDIKDRHPNVTDREIRDTITGYGQTVNPSKDQVETDIRKMTRMGRLISALEDVAQKKRPLRSGKQRDSLDAQERALNKELKAAMKELPVDDETEAEQLKTSLDAVKTRLKNKIEELNLAIETGKKAAKAQGAEYDAEAKTLAEERDQIKEIYDSIFYKRDDDATKIENVLKNTEKAIEATIKRIENNELEAKKQSTVNSPDVKAVRERLARVKDRLHQLQEEAGIPAKKRLAATKKRIQDRIDELKERLETGNFDKKAKPTPVIRDNELIRLDAQVAGLKEQFAKEQYKIELANRTTSQKWMDRLIEAWGLSRVFKATSEISFVMIQGWVYTTNAIRDPRTAIEGVKNMWQAFRSPAKAEEFMNMLRAQPYYSEMKAAKLAIAEADVKLTAREEGFISGWGNLIWNFTGYVVGSPLSVWKPAYKAFTTGWIAINPMNALERANHAYMNTLRTTKYLQGREMLGKEGKNFQANPQDYKDLADVINTFTGRASLGSLDRVAKPLAVVFFSPRNWASVIKTATPVAFYHFGKMGSKLPGETTTKLLLQGKVKPSVAQKLALMDYFTAIGLTTAIVMLIDGFSDDDDEITVEKDPRSTDFMKIKIGDTRIDPWGGRIQMIVLQTRLLPTMLGGGYTKNTNGDMKRLGQGITSTRGDLLGDMVKNKLSPSAAIAWDLFNMKVKKYHGEEILTNKFGGPLLIEDPENNFSPIFWETVGELYEEQPATVASFLTFLAFIGYGVSTYSKEDQKKKNRELIEMRREEIDAAKNE